MNYKNIKIEAKKNLKRNYFKNVLPQNKLIRQILLLPFILIFNFFGTLFGNILPKDQTSYFNNVFILEKME